MRCRCRCLPASRPRSFSPLPCYKMGVGRAGVHLLRWRDARAEMRLLDGSSLLAAACLLPSSLAPPGLLPFGLARLAFATTAFESRPQAWAKTSFTSSTSPRR